jgi:hypothetical protein
MSAKKPKNTGQQWMGGIEQGVEEDYAERPLGMPVFSVIKAETTKLGLPDTDAEAIYDAWLANGFKNGRGRRIKNWRAALRNWHRYHYFPSQKVLRRKPQGTDERAKDAIRKMRNG